MDFESDNLDLQAASRELVEEFAKGHLVAIKCRDKMESVGRMLFGVSLGLFLGFIVRGLFVPAPFHWWDWMFLAIGVVGFAATNFGLWINGRWLKAHRASYNGMVGLLNSPPRSNLKRHHFEQAYAALHDLEKLVATRDKWLERLPWKRTK